MLATPTYIQSDVQVTRLLAAFLCRRLHISFLAPHSDLQQPRLKLAQLSRGESVLSCCPSGEDLPSRAPLVDPTSCGPRPSPVIQSAIVRQERHNIIPMYVSETVCNTQRLSGFFYLEACGWIHRLWAKGTQAQFSASLIEMLHNLRWHAQLGCVQEFW